jgi:hypothetical protein
MAGGAGNWTLSVAKEFDPRTGKMHRVRAQVATIGALAPDSPVGGSRKAAQQAMEPFLIVLVVVLLLAATGGVGYLYWKEAGPDAPQLWLTGSRRIRQAMGSSTAIARREQESATTSPVPLQVSDYTPAISPQVIDDGALRSLREEVLGELRQAAGRSREFDVRLARIEHQAATAPDISTEMRSELAGLREKQQVEFERIEVTLRSVHVRAGSYGQRRGEALASLYASLARVESSLASVVNPMLLPGESLTLLPELPAEAMTWATWSDVGEAAYTFGDVFNQNRLLLDPSTATDIGRFIATLRQALTGSVYPTVRDGKPTAERLAQMRSGLESIVAALPVVRRQIEAAYREDLTGPASAP